MLRDIKDLTPQAHDITNSQINFMGRMILGIYSVHGTNIWPALERPWPRT